MGFSREAFEEAYKQGLESSDRSVEMGLTSRTHKRVLELESKNYSIEMIMIGFEKAIILYRGGMYEVIRMEKA